MPVGLPFRTSVIDAESLMSGLTSGAQTAAAELGSQTTILTNPSDRGPADTRLDVGWGALQDGNPSGVPCAALAAPASQGSNAGTSETRSGEAPMGEM